MSNIDDREYLRHRLRQQISYSANLQRFVEALIQGRDVPESVLAACPHHAYMLNHHEDCSGEPQT